MHFLVLLVLLILLRKRRTKLKVEIDLLASTASVILQIRPGIMLTNQCHIGSPDWYPEVRRSFKSRPAEVPGRFVQHPLDRS